MAAVVAVLVLVILGLTHHASSTPGTVDAAASDVLRRVWPMPGRPFYLIDAVATPVPVLVAAAVLVALALWSRRPRLALLAVLAPLGSAAVTTVLKPVVDRTIHGDNLSFPSGHSAYATSLGLVVGLLLVGLATTAGTAGRTALLLGPGLFLGAVMAVDQTALDAHYATDTVGGVCTALVVLVALALAIDLLSDHSGGWRLRGRRRDSTIS